MFTSFESVGAMSSSSGHWEGREGGDEEGGGKGKEKGKQKEKGTEEQKGKGTEKGKGKEKGKGTGESEDWTGIPLNDIPDNFPGFLSQLREMDGGVEQWLEGFPEEGGCRERLARLVEVVEGKGEGKEKGKGKGK